MLLAANSGRSVESFIANKDDIIIVVGTEMTVVSFDTVFSSTTNTPFPAPLMEEARISQSVPAESW